MDIRWKDKCKSEEAFRRELGEWVDFRITGPFRLCEMWMPLNNAKLQILQKASTQKNIYAHLQLFKLGGRFVHWPIVERHSIISDNSFLIVHVQANAGKIVKS